MEVATSPHVKFWLAFKYIGYTSVHFFHAQAAVVSPSVSFPVVSHEYDVPDSAIVSFEKLS